MSEIKSMKLYTHVERIYRELGELGITVDDRLSVDELCAFDQLHYHGTHALDVAMAMIGIDGAPRWLEIGSGLGGPARYIAAYSDTRITASSNTQSDGCKQYGGIWYVHIAGGFPGTQQVTLRDMGNFVRQYGSQFAFGLRGENQSAIYANVAARSRKRIDLWVVDNEEIEGLSRFITVGGKTRAELLNVVRDQWVIMHRLVLAYIAHEGAPQFTLLFRRHQ